MNDFYYLSHGGPGSGRYPLGSGDRPYQKFEKSRRGSSGVSEYIRSRRLKKEEKRRADEIRRKIESDEIKRKHEVDKGDVLRRGTATDVLKYQGELSNQELREVAERIRLENDLRSYSKREMKSKIDEVNKIMNTVKIGTEWIKIATETYNSIAAIYNATPDGQKKPLTLVKRGDIPKKK